MTRIALVSTILAFAVAFAGCATPQENDPTPGTGTPPTNPTPAQGSIAEAAVTASDFKFDGPATVPAGLVRFTLTNAAAQELHHIQLLKLATGKTAEDVAAFFSGPPSNGSQGPPAFPWSEVAGGPNAPRPGGGQSAAIVDLAAGEYAYVCFIPSADGVPHVAKGMVAPLRVTAPPAAAATPPTPSVKVTLSDFNFTFAANVTAGEATVEYRNAGPLTHEAFLARLAPGKHAEDLLAYFAPGAQQGPPPAEPFGGITSIEPGALVYARVTFEPGTYVFVCFDEAGGAPHFTKGMVKEFTVA